MLTEQQLIGLVKRADPVADTPHTAPRRDARTLLAAAEERRAMTTNTLTDREPDTATTRRRRTRPAVAFAAALVITLVVIGVAALLLRGDGSDAAGDPAGVTTAPAPSTTVVPSTTPASQPTPSATESPSAPSTVVPSTSVPTTAGPGAPPEGLGPLDGTWTETVFDLEADGFLWNPVATRLGIVAPGPAGIWISRNGTEWHRSMEFPTEQTSAPTIIEYGSTVYAFGMVGTESSTEIRQVVWRSDDGSTWTEMPAPTNSPEIIGSAVVSGDTLLVSGDRFYLSRDGTTWSTLEHRDTGLADLTVAAVIGHDGGFLAVAIDYGADPEAYPDGRSMLYSSASGEVWEPIPGSELPLPAIPSGLLAVDDTVYVRGIAGEGIWGPAGPALWRSDGGAPFVPVDLGASSGKPGWVADLLATDRGLVVMVDLMVTDTDPASMVLLAETPDGTFTPMPIPDGLRDGGSQDGVVFGEQIVILNSWDGAARQWTWTPGG